jgi:hypothetical protein
MGALEVTRSYGSHGLFDVRAIFPDHVKLIQVKKDRLGKTEMKQLKAFRNMLTTEAVKVEVWMYPDRTLKVIRL